jgi:hypothetical protein
MDSHVFTGRAPGARLGRAMGARPVRIVASAVLATAAVVAPMGAAGVTPLPTDRQALVDSLLQAEDLASYDAMGEVEDVSADDLPTFAANDGIREVTRRWYDQDRMSIVFDFRFQFPDAESAESFLDATDDILGEVTNGSVRQEPPVRPLADTRFYYFEDAVLGTGTQGYAFLLRHQNIAAKVWVSGAHDSVSADEAGAIASAAADRMLTAVGDVPAPTPHGSGEPTALGELGSHIPAAVSADCAEEIPEGGFDEGELARLVCTRSVDSSIVYSLFDSTESLDGAFDVASAVAGILGWEPAGSCEAGGYEGTWTLGGAEAGRLLCVIQLGTANITWSHPATGVLAIIRQEDGDPAAAWQLWLVAGPE